MRLVLVALVLLLAAILLGTANPAVVIGAVYPTGPAQGSGGTEEFRGASLAALYVNLRGGLHRRPIWLRLEQADSWDAAPAAVERLVRTGVTVIAGSYGSSISRPAADTASRLGVIYWETGAVGEFGMDAARGEKVFRFSPAGDSLGRSAVAFIRDALTPRVQMGRPLRYAVAYVDDVYGRAVARGAISEVQESGLLLVAVLPYSLNRVDFDALASQLANAHPDVLVVGTYLQDGVQLRRALIRAKLPLVANIGCSSYCMAEFGRILGQDAVGLFASDKPDGYMIRMDRLSPEAAWDLRWARAEYRRRYHSDMSGPALSGFAGGLALFQHILPSASDLSPSAVAGAALKVRLPVGALPNGSGLAFAPPGQPDAGANLRAISVICQWIGPNTRAVVWPPAFATHPIVLP